MKIGNREKFNAPLVTVVIATMNEEKNIGTCIQSLREQVYKNIEIIVVDNNSTDNTVAIVKKSSVQIYMLSDYIDLSTIRNYRGAQVNLGIKNSNGVIVFFPDADMTFEEHLIAEAVESLGEYDALFIPEKVVGNGLLGKIRDFERSFYNMTCIDSPRLCRKLLYETIGGFDEKAIQFGPDDWDLAKKMKVAHARFGITNSKIYHHEDFKSWSTYINKKTKYFDTFSPYIKKWGDADSDIKKQFGLFYRFFGVFTENKKWKKLVSNPILTVQMFILRFIVGLRYFISQEVK